MTISILAISKMFRAKWPLLIEGQYLDQILRKESIEKVRRKVFRSIESIEIYIFNPIIWRNGLSGRAHASEETLNSNRFLLVNVAPAMEGDQSSRDMTAFGYRQKNYTQGCR